MKERDGKHKMKPTWRNLTFATGWENKMGFVYRIKEIDTGMLYYGIKKFHKRVRRKPLKGKKRIRIDYVESDWKTYKTSSPIVQDKLIKNPENYLCDIVRVCDSVTEMKAHETYLQLKHYINGEFDKLYNQMINLRLRIR